MLRHSLCFKHVKFLLGYTRIRNEVHCAGKWAQASEMQQNNAPVISFQKPQSHVLYNELHLISSEEIDNPLVVDSSFEGVTPIVSPSFNLASLVNKSELLQLMVKLGVSIYQWERKADVHSWIMALDFKKDVQPIIQFLVDQGVASHSLGHFFTKNPYILKSSIGDLEIRTNYLHSKKFSSEMISRILSRNPHWLLFSPERIDNRLGFVQQTFNLTGDEVRAVATKESRLITCSLQGIKLMNFGFKEEMGFEANQIKELLLAKPKLWLMNKSMLVDRFDYLHNTMKMDHESVLRFPAALTCRGFRIKQRHEFLCHLNRAQYDPKLPRYVSLLQIISDSDAHFAVNIARSSIQDFNDFCKTM
ncbi:transcription termination factor 3, mitochondrial-like [Daphnia carinata]|uniref:transcription termination factor 3, mitochondrial-like n=1 Tax=Daphnia carinata TaxID=120202 RepID=UPI00257B2808|nr:transcription termination factor 3, mitochondrial-like [Daphnia carinata]